MSLWCLGLWLLPTLHLIMTLEVLSSPGHPSVQVPPGKGLHKKTLFLFMLIQVVVNVPVGSFRGQKDVVNSKLEADGYRWLGATWYRCWDLKRQSTANAACALHSWASSPRPRFLIVRLGSLFGRTRSCDKLSKNCQCLSPHSCVSQDLLIW